MQLSPPLLHATYFDGKCAKAHAVALHIHQAVLNIQSTGDAGLAGDAVALQVPVAQVVWPERTRYGQRMAELPSGGMLQCANGAAWDAWC
jgi:hypothetical protein